MIPSLPAVPTVGRGTPGSAAPNDVAPLSLGSAAADGTSTTTLAYTVPAGGYAAGTFLVLVGVVGQAKNLSSIADTGSNTYNIREATTASDNGNIFLADAKLTTALAAGDSITMTYSGAAISAVQVIQYDSLDATSWFDTSATATFDGSVDGTGGEITPAAAGELIIGGFAMSGSPVLTAGPGFVGRPVVASTVQFIRSVGWESKIGTADAVTATATFDSAPGSATGVTAAYVLAS